MLNRLGVLPREALKMSLVKEMKREQSINTIIAMQVTVQASNKFNLVVFHFSCNQIA